MPLSFALTWDYRCPFARNAHEHVIVGLRDGADWDVTFSPFSLGQVHVGEGETDVWDEPARDSGLVALQAGVIVRDQYPDRFLDVHEALFAARHDRGLLIKDPAVVHDVLAEQGVDADAVFAEISSANPLETVRKEHEAMVASHDVWGVPTFVAGPHASFVRLMHRPEGDAAVARQTVERVLSLLIGWPELNEFKHTNLDR